MLRAMAKSTGKGNKAEAPRSMRARAVADLLPSVGGAAFRRFGFVQSSVVSRWREIVGARYAGVSAPEAIRFPPGKKSGGVLNLVVDGAHAPLLQHLAPEIVERVNRFFGYPAVARIAFCQGHVRVAERARRAPPSLRPVAAEIGDTLRPIADPELREVLEALARGVSAREERREEAAAMLGIPVLGKLKG